MKHEIVRGSIVALITPFLPNGEVNYEKLGELVDRFYECYGAGKNEA